MPRSSDPQQPKPRHLRLLPATSLLPTNPLPMFVPLLRPDQPVTPTQDALLTDIARHARLGNIAARDLLWRSFAARLEPVVLRCGRMTWQQEWVRRNGRPWELDDLRQEAWLVFADLIVAWNGEGLFFPYITSHFPWRLHTAIRGLGPIRRTIAVPVVAVAKPDPAGNNLLAAEGEELLVALVAALSPSDAQVLQMRIVEEIGITEIARRRGVSRRTGARQWARIRRVAHALLAVRLRGDHDSTS